MWIIWGTVPSAEQDLGVIADRCPRCQNVAACRVTGIAESLHVFFVPLIGGITQTINTCGHCGGQFACESWRYRKIIPTIKAISMSLGEILAQTNPALQDELEWARLRKEFASDPRFEMSLQSLGELRPGALSTRLRNSLRLWGGMDEVRREGLVRDVDDSTRTTRFAKSIAPLIPRSAGCLVGFSVSVAVWSASLLIPAVRERSLWWGIGVGFAGLIAGVSVYQFLLGRQVRRWTHEVLVPEGRKLGIDFRQFVAFLDDLPPPEPRSEDVLGPLQEQAMTIRKALAEFELEGSKKIARETDPDGF